MDIKKFISEEVKTLHKKTLLESEKNKIEKELKMIEEGFSRDSNLPPVIFNVENISQADAIQYFKENFEGVVPVFKASSGSFGTESIYLVICFQPKEEWPNGYLENSNYLRMVIDQSGTMEVFTQSLYQKGKSASRETRLPVKFRKARAKSLQDAKDKLMKLIDIIKEYYK